MSGLVNIEATYEASGQKRGACMLLLMRHQGAQPVTAIGCSVGLHAECRVLRLAFCAVSVVLATRMIGCSHGSMQ